LARGRGGPTITRGLTDLGGVAVDGTRFFNLSISGTRIGGGDDEGGIGDIDVTTEELFCWEELEEEVEVDEAEEVFETEFEEEA